LEPLPRVHPRTAINKKKPTALPNLRISSNM
jgi:hypothetical protein